MTIWNRWAGNTGFHGKMGKRIAFQDLNSAPKRCFVAYLFSRFYFCRKEKPH